MGSDGRKWDAEGFILRVAQKLKPEQYEFTVEVGGVPYDVYWFEVNGKVGQLAWAKIDGKVEIAMFHPGRRSIEEVTAHMEKAAGDKQ